MKVGPSKKQVALEEKRIAQENLRIARQEKRDLLIRDKFAERVFAEERARLSGLRGRSVLLSNGEVGFPRPADTPAATGPAATPNPPAATNPGTAIPVPGNIRNGALPNPDPGRKIKRPKRGSGGSGNVGFGVDFPGLNRVFLK